MVEFGKLLVLLGVGSFALHFFGLEFKYLLWIDLWGENIGHIIRAGLTAAGVVLVLVGWKLSSREEGAPLTTERPAQA